MAYANHMVSLKAAAEDKSNPSVSKTTAFAVDPRVLVVEPGFNARPLNADHVASLSLALRNGAVFPPIEVRVEDGKILIVDGHHRHAAALDAIEKGFDIKALDARHFRGNDIERVAHMITSAGGLPLTPLQLGIQYRKLMGWNWTEKLIADRVGKTVVHVKDMITLAEANSDVHQAVNAGAVSGTTALEIVKEHGSKAGAVINQALEQAKAEGKSKVTPSVLAKQQGQKSLSDKQILAWLLDRAQRNGPGAPNGEWGFSIRFEVAAPAAGANIDLRAALAAAISAKA